MPTKIVKGKYWDKSWNPIVVKGGGWHCTKTSAGCLHCWAEQQNLRFGNKLPYDNRKVEFVLNEKILQQLLKRKIPTTYFVCDLCDLFHEAVLFEFICKVLRVIEQCEQHTFQILTKRPKIAYDFFGGISGAGLSAPPLKNLHLGVSISTQAEDWKIAELLKIPAAVRFVSLEPLLGEIDILQYLPHPHYFRYPHFLNWGVIGCESINGRAGRFQDGLVEAAINLVRQHKAAGIPVFVKQIPLNGKVSKNMAEWPEELRVQEMPGQIT